MPAMIRIPVLCYHSLNIDANHYSANDHLALAADLRALHAAGRRVIPLHWVVEWVRGRRPDSDVRGGVALSLDDGSWFDYYDMEHPRCGRQRGMLGIVQDFQREVGAQQPHLHITSFVIASPQARAELDRTCLVERGWWGDEWWREASAGGLMSIENHSWDHLHPTLDKVAHSRQAKNDFTQVDNFTDARAQIAQASQYIARYCGRAPRLFAYPWGQSSDYLTREYFPYAGGHGLYGAFTTQPRPVVRDDNPWLLPRYVCGCHWRTPEQLTAVLNA